MITSPSIGLRTPLGTCEPLRLQPATVSVKPGGEKRARLTLELPTMRPVSSHTASKTTPDSAPSATRVASRRSASRSWASRCRPSRASLFAIATASSSVKLCSRASVEAGSGSTAREPIATTPHSAPSTITGTPTPVLMPALCTRLPSTLSTSA